MEDLNFNSLRPSVPKTVSFSMYSSNEIRKLSVAQVITPLTFNAIGHPLPGSLYDPALGPIDSTTVCPTCGQRQLKCSGHMGHIELPLVVVNPLYHKSLIGLLKLSCLSCYRILIPHEVKSLLIGQITLLHHGYLVEAVEISSRLREFANDWERLSDYDRGIAAAKAIDEIVKETLDKGTAGDREWKGEMEIRAEFIKSAKAQVYRGKSCKFCKVPKIKITTVGNRILIPQSKVKVADKFTGSKQQKDGDSVGEVVESHFSYYSAEDCLNALRELSKNDGEFIKVILPVTATESSVDVAFMEVIPVPPTNTRPVSYMNGAMFEHATNTPLKAILNDCLVINSLLFLLKNGEADPDSNLSSERLQVVSLVKGATHAEKLQHAWQELQKNVDSLLDAEVVKSKTTVGLGLKQIIERKEGIIRMNMMGKRVNFAARTVITPDPNLNIDEIGVPEAFAIKLTYPVPVTHTNVAELRKLIMNGPLTHPGANLVELEDGTMVKLSENNPVQRGALAKKLLTPGNKKGVKILHRHLINGDVLLLNRQPTLHRPSIMAHKARVLKGEKTFRLHYANCKAYNADFDGDEMNAHFPQSEVARSEAYNLVTVSKQYLVPKDGTPLSGLIQDHVISGVKLSTRGRFFTRDEYMNFVFQGLSFLKGDIKTLPPAIIRPVPLWSGKQIISTVIINVIPKDQIKINLSSTAKISAKAWAPKRWKFDPGLMSEAEVIIREGELLVGVLDKMHYGSTPYSLVHCMYELYGGDTATQLLSSFAKLFTAFLQSEGFTLGVKDILVVPKADARRKKIIKTVKSIGEDLVRKVVEVEEGETLEEAISAAFRKDPMFRAVLDHQYKGALDGFTNKINEVCLPAGLLTPFPRNNLQLMVQSGAKGSTVNTMQISCLLGQIELEGKRPPLMISGRSLPSFPPFDTSPRAGGFVDGRFLTGIQPQEFFFHCMAGREGLIDTAVKTSRSGYLQRCLVKHLEGLSVNYDMTVRDSDGSIVQYLYGEDGMEVNTCQFLTPKSLPFLVENMSAIRNQSLIQTLKEGSDVKGIKSHLKSLRKWKKHFDASQRRKPTRFSLYSVSPFSQIPSSSGSLTKETLTNLYRRLPSSEKETYAKQCRRCPDPVNSKFQADHHFGSITEKLDELINSYVNTHDCDEEGVKEMIQLKAMMSLAHPGEPVGLLAAQSVGEPSTQMTLNTFHFAGRGEMNVTLGIPRLREVLMVASKNIKTPSMEVPFRTDVRKLEKKATRLRKSLYKTTMADVIQCVTIREKMVYSPRRRQVYILRLQFLPQAAYKDSSEVTPQQILKHVEEKFIRAILHFIRNQEKKIKELINEEVEKTGGGGKEDEDMENGDPQGNESVRGPVRDDSSDDEPVNDDEDATTARRRNQQNEEQQYDDLEDDDPDVQAEIEGTASPINAGSDDENDDEEKSAFAREHSDRRAAVLASFSQIADYTYDSVNSEWCEITLDFPVGMRRIDFAGKLKDLASSSVISQVQGIRRAFTTVTASGQHRLKVEGQNLKEMYKHMELLDLNKLYSNDVHAVAGTYGIEAATKVIVKEIQDVFKVYGITVDPRHLTLIADYMTFDGTYRPLSRKGMEGGASPLQQMSFESSLAFLRTSVIRAKKDDLQSPSARLMLGLPTKIGTSAFGLVTPFT